MENALLIFLPVKYMERQKFSRLLSKMQLSLNLHMQRLK